MVAALDKDSDGNVGRLDGHHGTDRYLSLYLSSSHSHWFRGSIKCDLDESKFRALAILDLAFLIHAMTTEEQNGITKNLGDEKAFWQGRFLADGNKESPANEAEEKER
ncbi:hypothetical protein SESBI_31737 [Sesbania bispinosa]|nr:hypothetical protein SESBI_31737 [Sesbania bispinosa]